MNVAPKKYLGQHFLKNDKICEAIVSRLTNHGNYKHVLEIGPGTGALTRHLLQLPEKDIQVVEIDRESVAYSEKEFPALQGKIIEKDFLQLPLDHLYHEPLAVIGNFPYHISSQILFRILDFKTLIPEVVGMFQKEVAVRITGKPGGRDYGILSVFIQAVYETEYLFTVDENEFFPPPKVKSGVIRLKKKLDSGQTYDEKLFRQLVKTAFNQRRKIMRNSLKNFYPGKVDLTDPLFDKRPEQLDFQAFIDLSCQYQKK